MKQYAKHMPWLAAAAIIFVIFGAIYGIVQQAERTGANFPQVQIAEDIAAALNKGAPVNSFTAGHVDVNASLAPFVIIYDRTGRAVGGSGYLGGTAPVAPRSMLEASLGQEYHAVTWQPENGVRIASATVASQKYYVLSGRNLREVERDENRTFWLAAFGGVVSETILGGCFIVSEWHARRTK